MTVSVAQKVLRTFVFAFAGIFLPCLANVLFDASSTADWTVAKAALISGIFAASSAAVRAVIAVLPVFKDDEIGLQRGGS
jgi:hypothetical protein